MDKPLALLTGVGRSVGIGAGIARQLAADGWDLEGRFGGFRRAEAVQGGSELQELGELDA